MAIVRLYSGPDGESHLEDLPIESHPELTQLQAAKGISFRTYEPTYFHDWHNAPRRQYVITLAGQVEIGLGDGTKRVFGAGDALLAEDLTGRGHTTRVVGGAPRLTATVHLGDG